MGKVTILETTTLHPITLMGERAGICWGADISDPEKNYQRGLDCIESGHDRVMEYVNVEMVLDGYSARVIREWYTHIYGFENNEPPTRLQASTRYIDYNSFEYITPKSIKQDMRTLARYDSIMREIRLAAQMLDGMGVPREDIANILPLGMTTKIVDKRTLRSLVCMSRNRMCSRAYWEFREMFMDISKALSDRSVEWTQVVRMTFHPKCDDLRFCPEKKKSCGRWPTDRQ